MPPVNPETEDAHFALAEAGGRAEKAMAGKS
jgi:hypothetical protein